MKLTYKDFETGKQRFTRGRFREFTEPTGLLNARYAVIDRGKSTLLIPRYCLTEESKRAIDYEIKCRGIPAKITAELRLSKPRQKRKHLFGISRKGYGYFLVDTPDRRITLDAAREMFIEATAEGLKRPIHVYCACSNIFGEGLDILQVGWDG